VVSAAGRIEGEPEMNRCVYVAGWLVALVCAGCNSDIVTTHHLKELGEKRVYIAPLESEDPQVGQVIRGVLEKEFIRRRVALSDPNDATVIITGATFMTTRGKSAGTLLGSSSSSIQACESVSVTAKDRENRILLSASYDNKDRCTVSEFARKFGSALAAKFR
jgi:hypothetical protein